MKGLPTDVLQRLMKEHYIPVDFTA
jgi:hypothetical protein